MARCVRSSDGPSPRPSPQRRGCAVHDSFLRKFFAAFDVVMIARNLIAAFVCRLSWVRHSGLFFQCRHGLMGGFCRRIVGAIYQKASRGLRGWWPPGAVRAAFLEEVHEEIEIFRALFDVGFVRRDSLRMGESSRILTETDCLQSLFNTIRSCLVSCIPRGRMASPRVRNFLNWTIAIANRQN
jgi:hypothetical protein